VKILIIGGVAAGLKAAARARRGDPTAEITVIEKGKLISYGACGLPYYVSGDVDDISQLMSTPAGAIRNVKYFEEVKDITVITETLATEIDRAAKQVAVRNLVSGEEKWLDYDKLVIATGAVPVKPPIEGIELANVYQLWHPDDAKKVRAGLEKGKFTNAVIIGAGLVGLEMAEALKIWDVNVTLIEMKEQIFPAFLDEEVAGAVAKYVREHGLTVLTGEKVERFTGVDAVREVLTDKRTIPADLVILAVGVRPNVELARNAGLTIGQTGAIAVDERLRTSDPDIFAGGDCVENTNLISGEKVFAPMGSTANKHGRVIGDNLLGGDEKFRGILGTVVVKVMDMNVGKTGLTEGDVKRLGFDYVTAMVGGHDRPHYMPEAKLITVKLIAEAATGRILGAQAFGEGEVAKRIDVVAMAITMGGTVNDLINVDLAYAPPYSSPIDNVAVAAQAVLNKLAGKLKSISSLAARKRWLRTRRSSSMSVLLKSVSSRAGFPATALSISAGAAA
jgi:NADPH-dependent 2,4-dienoyl-CoA reductase/sulfur reductase-like enzyme